MAGNKGFADLVTKAGAGEGPRLPRASIMAGRSNSLSRLATGGLVTRHHELVDPARCRMWEGHNRDYDALNESRCADLIESLRAQGRQEVPAIVRRLPPGGLHEFEVVCGARRHWSIGWLRSHDYPEFRFLIEARELTDEEAFRLADLENRNRCDLSDYERAHDYARAIERYYAGSQQRMVERLKVSKSWLSRFLELAKLPPSIVAAFPSPHDIAVKHAATLAPLLRSPVRRAQLVTVAEGIAAEQAVARYGEGTFVPAASVVRRLSAAAHVPDGKRKPDGPMQTVRSPAGAVIVEGRARRGIYEMRITPPAGCDPDQIVDAVRELLTLLSGAKPSRRQSGAQRMPRSVP